jgi:hypothetical protein
MRELHTKYGYLVDFIRQHPEGCTSRHVKDRYPEIGGNATRKALEHLHTQGHLVRQRETPKEYRYFTLENDPCIGRLAPVDTNRIDKLEALASSLKKRGLYRRAADVYAELMWLSPSVVQIEQYARERSRCIARSKRGTVVYSDDDYQPAGRFVGSL